MDFNVIKFVNEIKPKSNVSDKYSLLLYKFLQKNANSFPFKYDFCVLYDETEDNFNPSFPKVQHMLIGGIPFKHEEPHTFFGNRINSILCDTSRDIFCMYPWAAGSKLGTSKKIIDITEWFVRQYIEIGRCLFDPHHNNFIMNPETRFAEVLLPNYVQSVNNGQQIVYDDRKYCNWCGKLLFKMEKEEIIVKKTEIWTAY